MRHYQQFTIEDREEAMVLLSKGASFREIGRQLGCSHTSVSREFARNTDFDGIYYASHAQRKAEKRRKKCGLSPILQREPQLLAYVCERLALRWSPEQIAGRLSLDRLVFPNRALPTISFNSIYRAVKNHRISRQYRKYFRFKYRKAKRKRADDRRGRIHDTVPISNRPAVANERKEVGHWESDTVQGIRGTGCFATHVERMTGFLIA
jgi:IS30 family transposase